jgi:glycosyltransferase involved in cell wall biosynthesis
VSGGQLAENPSVSVVIATRDRPQLLRAAVQAVRAQEYAGVIETIAVFDRSEPDPSLADDDPLRPVRVVTNDRSPGLPGARNTGIQAATGELVGFCDDDDSWLPAKLRAQVDSLRGSDAVAATTGILVVYGDREVVRLAPKAQLTAADFARERVMAAHPSTFLVRRADLLERIGMVDEEIPGGYGEDYDWILRAAQVGSVAAVQEPLVRVLWHPKSFFSQRWESIAAATDYLLAKHPVLAADRAGFAQHLGRKAFALAALGRRRDAVVTARRALRASPRERRAYLALLIAARVLRPEWVMRAANASGRGI